MEIEKYEMIYKIETVDKNLGILEDILVEKK